MGVKIARETTGCGGVVYIKIFLLYLVVADALLQTALQAASAVSTAQLLGKGDESEWGDHN